MKINLNNFSKMISTIKSFENYKSLIQAPQKTFLSYSKKKKINLKSIIESRYTNFNRNRFT